MANSFMIQTTRRPALLFFAIIVTVGSLGTLSLYKSLHRRNIVKTTDELRPIHVPTKLPRKLIIVSYMRGGSTFVGGLFDNNPVACYWFEPLHGIMEHVYGFLERVKTLDMSFNMDGTRRIPPPTELENYQYHIYRTFLDPQLSELPLEHILSIFTRVGSWTKDIFKCAAKRSNMNQFNLNSFKSGKCKTCYPQATYANLSLCYMNQNIPQTNQFLQKRHFTGCYPSATDCHRKCMKYLKSILSDCLKLADNRCGKRNITAMKTVRVSIAMVEGLIKKDPEVKIVHYVRDPRGVYTSRKKAGKWILSQASFNDLFTEIKFHCLNVMQNLRDAKRILSKYPGSIITVRYEDFAADPIKYANELYHHVNLPLPDVMKTWVLESAHATRNNGAFGTKRVNSSHTALKWKEIISDKELKLINKRCREVINELDYPLLATLSNN